MPSEREETLVEQLQIKERRIKELEEKIRECLVAMEELQKAAERMLELWEKQQARIVLLDALMKGKS